MRKQGWFAWKQLFSDLHNVGIEDKLYINSLTTKCMNVNIC